jgi:hypothetical protein
VPLVPSPTILSTDEMGRVAPPIMTSVGRGGVNDPKDVFVVQSLLNQRLPKPHSPVPVNGLADPGLILAIEAYQAVLMGMLPPSGRVDPGSPTFYALAARPLIEQERKADASSVGHLGRLPDEVVTAAVSSFKRWSVPASVTLAQWIVESAWGTSVPPDSNNPFGMKALPGQPAVESSTREISNGESVVVTARFRQFDSLSDAFDQHGRLLATGVQYHTAMTLVASPEAFADALSGIYATDPQYGSTLKWVIKNYGLAQYDR